MMSRVCTAGGLSVLGNHLDPALGGTAPLAALPSGVAFESDGTLDDVLATHCSSKLIEVLNPTHLRVRCIVKHCERERGSRSERLRGVGSRLYQAWWALEEAGEALRGQGPTDGAVLQDSVLQYRVRVRGSLLSVGYRSSIESGSDIGML